MKTFSVITAIFLPLSLSGGLVRDEPQNAGI
jgi:hypothetical protein